MELYGVKDDFYFNNININLKIVTLFIYLYSAPSKTRQFISTTTLIKREREKQK